MENYNVALKALSISSSTFVAVPAAVVSILLKFKPKPERSKVTVSK
jgi:hypothetical protein